jgi:hypothetical protein
MNEWLPDAAPLDLEEKMEARDIPEQDRDEMRRFAEVLRRRKDRREGKTLSPVPPEMIDWLTGKD